MFHKLRSIHKQVGLVASLFLLVLSITGFLLAIKSQASWMRPTSHKGEVLTDYLAAIGPGHAMQSAFNLNDPRLKTPDDIDRLEYRVKDNLYKVLSKTGCLEVQVCGETAKVLGTGQRNDQLVEDLHDFSFFADALHTWGLPAIAVGLFALSVTGICMYATPVIRRARFNRSQKTKPNS